MPEEQSINNLPVDSADDYGPGFPLKVETNINERQFPIPPRPVYIRGPKRNQRTRRVALVVDPGDYRGGCAKIFLDKFKMDTEDKCKLRAGDAEEIQCYTSEEFDQYLKNQYYRHWLVGATFGSLLYLIVLLFLILPEKYPKFDTFRESEMARTYIPVCLLAIAITMVFRISVALYLNIYLVLLVQISSCILVAFGNYNYDCDRFYMKAPFLGVGGIPLLLIGIFQEVFNVGLDRLIAVLYDARCLQSIVRLCSVNLLSELICLAINIRMLFI